MLTRTLVIAPHPDDEVIGAGVLLQRAAWKAVVFATDGAPADPKFWAGHDGRREYAKVRRREAEGVAELLHIDGVEFLADREPQTFVDQNLYRVLPQALAALSESVERLRPAALLTTAYEGGHPDHDVCNFLATRLSLRFAIPAFEMPLYHRSEDGRFLTQQWMTRVGNDSPVTPSNLEPTQAESRLKRTAIELYASQAAMLTQFTSTQESFRPIPQYDYSRPPHDGVLNYEAWGWTMTGTEVCAAMMRLNGRAAAHGEVSE